ncbi:hypothetical protein FHR53_003953 [Xanthomonas arboricola]
MRFPSRQDLIPSHREKVPEGRMRVRVQGIRRSRSMTQSCPSQR